MLEVSSFFFFNDTATTEIYTLSLHDALPICSAGVEIPGAFGVFEHPRVPIPADPPMCLVEDRKSTRLNSSHSQISYAVFCLKKNRKPPRQPQRARGGGGTDIAAASPPSPVGS